MCLALLQSTSPSTRHISCPTHTHKRERCDPLIEMHWWFSATSALCAAVRPRLGTDQHVCTMGRVVSAPSGRQWGAPCLPAPLDLEDEEWAPASVCVYVWRTRDTAISQDALVMFGDGGLWIGLCACIQNTPIYQFADILGEGGINIVHLQYDGSSSLITAALKHSEKPAIKCIFFVLGGRPELLTFKEFHY